MNYEAEGHAPFCSFFNKIQVFFKELFQKWKFLEKYLTNWIKDFLKILDIFCKFLTNPSLVSERGTSWKKCLLNTK